MINLPYSIESGYAFHDPTATVIAMVPAYHQSRCHTDHHATHRLLTLQTHPPESTPVSFPRELPCRCPPYTLGGSQRRSPTASVVSVRWLLYSARTRAIHQLGDIGQLGQSQGGNVCRPTSDAKLSVPWASSWCATAEERWEM